MNEQQRNSGRGHAGDAARLAQGVRPLAAQLFADLARQAANLAIIEIRRQRQCFVAALAFDLIALPFDVAGILDLNFHLFGDVWVNLSRPDAGQAHQLGVRDFRPAQQFGRPAFTPQGSLQHPLEVGLGELGRPNPRLAQPLAFPFDGLDRKSVV